MIVSSIILVADPPFILDDPEIGSGPITGFRITAEMDNNHKVQNHKDQNHSKKG